MVELNTLLPFWNILTPDERLQLSCTCRQISYPKGFQMHSKEDCRGIMYILSGQLRSFIVSEEGREVTLYRVFPKDMCVVAAAGLLDSIEMDVLVDAVVDTKVIMLPLSSLKPILQAHPEAQNCIYRIAAAHFADMVFNMQQIFFLSIDRRIAQFLWEEIERSGSLTVALTHDEIARYIGSAREVVSKVLKYFQSEGVLTRKRGKLVITSREKLKEYL